MLLRGTVLRLPAHPTSGRRRYRLATPNIAASRVIERQSEDADQSTVDRFQRWPSARSTRRPLRRSRAAASAACMTRLATRAADRHTTRVVEAVPTGCPAKVLLNMRAVTKDVLGQASVQRLDAPRCDGSHLGDPHRHGRRSHRGRAAIRAVIGDVLGSRFPGWRESLNETVPDSASSCPTIHRC